MKTLLAATDLSPRSDRAVAQAAHLAARLNARLVVTHVVDDELPSDVFDAERALALRALEKSTARLWANPLERVAIRVVGGLDFQAILATAAEEGADMIVLGAHRRSVLADLFTGTTVERVLRLATVPVLVVKRPAPGDYTSTLAALEMTEEAAHVLRLAHRLAGGRTLYAAHVLDDAAVRRVQGVGGTEDDIDRHRAALSSACEAGLRDIARTAGLDAADWLPAVTWGEPAPAIVRAAEDFAADLGVVGTRTAAKGAMERLLFGSVAERLLLDMPCDVLAVPLEGATPLPGAAAP